VSEEATFCRSRRDNVKPEFEVVHQRQKLDQFFLAASTLASPRLVYRPVWLRQRNLVQRGAGRRQSGIGLVSFVCLWRNSAPRFSTASTYCSLMSVKLALTVMTLSSALGPMSRTQQIKEHIQRGSRHSIRGP